MSACAEGVSPSTGGTFWGKYVEETGAWLPLAAHCLDVGIVFRRLCEVRSIHRSLQETTKTRLSSILLDRLAVIAMLHDIGRVNSGFQRKILPEAHIEQVMCGNLHRFSQNQTYWNASSQCCQRPCIDGSLKNHTRHKATFLLSSPTTANPFCLMIGYEDTA